MVRIKCPMIRAFYCWHKIEKDSRKHITENEQKKVDIEKAKST